MTRDATGTREPIVAPQGRSRDARPSAGHYIKADFFFALGVILAGLVITLIIVMLGVATFPFSGLS